MTDDQRAADLSAAAERLIHEATIHEADGDPFARDILAVARAILEMDERLRIATELLETFAAQRGQDMRYPGEHATLAEDALIRMSVVDTSTTEP